MDQIGPKVDQQGLEMVLLYRKFLFFAQILFSKHTLSEEIILNEIGQEGSHTINFALGDPCHTLYIEVEKMRQE